MAIEFKRITHFYTISVWKETQLNSWLSSLQSHCHFSIDLLLVFCLAFFLISFRLFNRFIRGFSSLPFRLESFVTHSVKAKWNGGWIQGDFPSQPPLNQIRLFVERAVCCLKVVYRQFHSIRYLSLKTDRTEWWMTSSEVPQPYPPHPSISHPPSSTIKTHWIS